MFRMRYRHNRRNTQQMLEGNHHGFAFNLRKRKLLRQQKTKNEQVNPCSYIQEEAKCRQKEIECPYPNSQVGYEHSIWSECRDSNPGPLGPEPSAIPNFATPRFFQSLEIIWHNEGFVKCFICLLREYFMNFRCFPLSDDKMPSAKLTDYRTKYRSCYNPRNLPPVY